MNTRTAILNILIRLQFPPFKQLFAFVYWLAIRISVLCLRRIPGIRAIYIGGSLAMGNALYGLSDIDFTVFIESESKRLRIDRAKEIFGYLRHLFPMLGPAEEKSIYFIDEFITAYENDPYLQFCSDPDFYKLAIIWGEDVLGNLSLGPLSDHKRHLSYIYRFNWWMEKLIELYCSDLLSDIEKRYVFFKAVCDVGLIYLKVKKGEYSFSGRAKTLTDLKEFIEEPERRLIEKMLRERRLLFRKLVIAPDDAFSLFKSLVMRVFKCFEEMPLNKPVSLTLSVDTQKMNSAPDVLGLADKILALCGRTEDVKVKIFQFTQNRTNPIGYKYFDFPTYLLETKSPIALERLRDLIDLYKNEISSKARLLIRENEYYAYSVHTEPYGSWLLNSPANNRLLFLRANEISSGTLHCKYTGLLKEGLIADILQAESALDDERINIFEPAGYLKFFFSLLQNLILYRAILSGQFLFLSTAAEIASYLRENTPLSHTFINRMFSEYVKSSKGQESVYEDIFLKSKIFLRTFIGIVKNNGSLNELEKINSIADSIKLSVSVVIITKSRATYLKRCLDSIVKLKSRPDEVVVVDHASTDSTKDVIFSFKEALPIKYVYTNAHGIGGVRNAGVRAASKDILAFIDDDAVADKKWLINIVKPFLKDPEIAIVGGSIDNMASNRKDIVYRYMDITSKLMRTT